jgi:hypothetical protein
MTEPLQEAAMSALRQMCGYVLIVIIALVVASCASTEPTTSSSAHRIDPVPPPSLSALDSVPRTNHTAAEEPPGVRSLADQAQRDVEAFLALRNAAREDAPASATQTPPADAQASRPVIEWEQHGAHRATAPASEESPNSALFSPEGDLLLNEPVEVPTPPSQSAASDTTGADKPAESTSRSDEPAIQTDPLRQQMLEAMAEIRRAAADSDDPLRFLLAIAALELVDPEQEIGDDMLYDLSEEERMLFRSAETFFSTLATDLPQSDDVQETMLAAIADLRAALAGTLTIPDAALCWRVDGFGKYEPFEPLRFLAHTDQKLIVYVELDDFESALNADNHWVTEIAQMLTIYDDSGLVVWGGRTWDASAPDVAAKRRRDFFLTQIVTLPQSLSVGKYTLKIRVRDEHSGAESEKSIDFEMVADPALAAQIPG